MTRKLLLIIGIFVAAALACNFTPLTPVPPTTSPVTATSVATAMPLPTLPPTSIPTATISPCTDDAAGRTQGCDEYTPQLDQVSRYDRNGVPQTACQGWCQIREGDLLETNSSGQAELNFSDCWPGRLFLFQTSLAQVLVSVCTKADFCPGGNCGNPPVVCVPNGALFADKCAGEFNPVTGSARIEKNTASYMVTYDEQADVTTIVVIDGVVPLRPVLQGDPLRLGDLVEMQGGQFLFTMPDESLREVGGLEPRVAHSVEQLPQVIQELGLEDWVIQAAETARESGQLPENWPSELSGRGADVLAGGGDLSNPETQLWLYRAINWNDLPVSDRRVRVYLSGEPVNAFDIDYLPARSAEALKPETLAIQLVFPAEDAELEATAAVIADYLAQAGVRVELAPTESGQMERLLRLYEARQQPYLYLSR